MALPRVLRHGASVLALAAALGTAAAPAEAITFNISWTGSAGYSMTGQFSYPDALIGTGPITGVSLTSLSIQGFLNAAPIGDWDFFADNLDPGTILNFNFNTTTEQFLVGGTSDSPTGQQWNTNSAGTGCVAPNIGFASGSFSQGLCVNGSFVTSIATASSTLTATEAPSAIPEPTTLALLGFSLAGLAAARRHARRPLRLG